MAAPVKSTETSAPRDFTLNPRAQATEEADDYFVTFWGLKGVDRSKLSPVDRQSFDKCLAVYVDQCLKLLANPAQQRELERRHNLSVAWANAQARAGRQVWGVEVPDSLFETVVVAPDSLFETVVVAPASRGRESRSRRRRGDATSRSGDPPRPSGSDLARLDRASRRGGMRR
jgi:hypothetical protein